MRVMRKWMFAQLLRGFYPCTVCGDEAVMRIWLGRDMPAIKLCEVHRETVADVLNRMAPGGDMASFEEYPPVEEEVKK